MNQKTLRIIFFSYLAVVFIGAVVLMLPFSHIGKLTFIDALFTSTSATCVTGLVVKVTPEDFTLFGQFILVLLMQVGGIGYMSIVTLFFLVMRKNLNIHEKNMAKDLKIHRNTAAKYFQELERVGIVKKFKFKQGYVYYNQKFLNILSY